MFNISSYLEKFKNFGQGEKLLKEVIINSVREVVGVEILAKDINLKNGEVTFKVSPAIKNTIYIKKDKVLTKIKENNSTIVNDLR
jgi:hypothetical protein